MELLIPIVTGTVYFICAIIGAMSLAGINISLGELVEMKKLEHLWARNDREEKEKNKNV